MRVLKNIWHKTKNQEVFMKKIYTPIKINGIELRNSVIMAPMSVGHTVDGFVDDTVADFYKSRALGGVGLIIFANMQWDKVRHAHNVPLLTDEKFIPQLKKMTDAIHDGGSKVFAQIMHRGTSAPRATIDGLEAVGPSAVPRKFTRYEMPRALTRDEIKEFIQWQAEAAVIAKRAGFDGIEIETNSGYLYGQFWSPLTNLRTDEYGGSLENRNRFMVETLAAIRAAVGEEYPIQLRVSGSDLIEGGCSGDDIAEICEYLDKTGNVDSFSVTAGWHDSTVPLITMEVPFANWLYLGRQIKAKVNVPVFQGMRMQISVAEEVVERGDVDGVVIGRQWLAESNLVNMAMAGEYDRIRPCVGCNALCLDAAQAGKDIGCIGNYECNREGELRDADGKFPSESKSEHPENILVIGAGPSGMEFARVSALRGHKVTIWEKRKRTIGLSLYAATPPRRFDIRYLGQWLERECRALGVEFVMGKEAAADDILAASRDYDRVVVAAGSKAAFPPIPIEEGTDVVHAWDVFEGNVSLGKNVVVVGGGDVGVEVAMYIGEIGTITAEQLRFMMIYKTEPEAKLKQLLNKGVHSVSVVEMGSKFAPDINPGSRWSIMYRTKQLGVDLMKETRVLKITKEAVVVENAEGQKSIPADTVVIAAGARPNNDLYKALEGKISKIDAIGDAVDVGRINNAIESAYRLAMTI
ncbi:MAG: NADH:flavin oxidoreductase [Bacteroidia bacterium]|nr:NADH:flavin oxidoreductase [Bacteroidia bacterium]